ncbi:glycosyltransferase [Pseudomonas granadensis]|uniref:Glycosyltransferase n=1 Tax=Pseudomonas granadensis TaxID=1421430 RepID=A0ABX7GCI6_9PSED|nr:glycosyltransferase [Pseudomonas granadensis]QRK82833.1 glycosyltransferase [Pseudomonas granadensis]
MNTLLTQAGYQLNEELKIWSRPDYASINYSDGDTTELRIKYLIDKARDVSVFSDELRGWCTDWPSLYYLSSTRANLLRVFDADLRGDVLEIGAGCGAITRYLGEQGGNVLALEGSARRASIARARTRDLPNVSVLAETFESFQIDKKFDVITLIGVFEYANLFVSGENPGANMLEKVRSLLKPDGLLIIAIENQLGLKYFAGAPEDHVVTPMFGVEGRYNSATPQTYGKQALASLLSSAGFTSNEFFAPFPDYKLPVSIVTEEGFVDPDFDAAAFAWQSAQRDPQLPELCTFSLELAWPQICKNGLGMDMSNSFLIGASPIARKTLDKGTLAVHFSSDRRAEFCKSSSFKKDRDSSIRVHYEKLAETQAEPAADSIIEFKLTASEPYVKGQVLSTKLIEIVNAEGWTYAQVGKFLNGYVDILKNMARDQIGADGLLPGHLFDAVPQNILIDQRGVPHLIDKEWSLTVGLRIEFLLFRALRQLLGSVTRFSPCADFATATYKEFVFAASAAAGYLIDQEDVRQFLLLEASVQSAVNGREFGEFLTWEEDRLVVIDNLLMAFNKSQSALATEAQALDAAGREIERIQADSQQVRSELECVRSELDSLQSERYRLSVRLAESQSAYNDVIHSNSWFITKPIRFAVRSLRNGKRALRDYVESCKRAATVYLRNKEVKAPASVDKRYIDEAPVVRVRSVTVILPVYKGIDMTKRCIEAAMPGILSMAGSKIIAINDCSPDVGMLDMLVELEAQWPSVLTVLDNPNNLGFVKTVNRGMRHAGEDDIVFLNSDVIVPQNWLERLTAEAYIAPNIGTVTPFSNNATICSFPAFLHENEQAFGLDVHKIDEVFAGTRLPNVKAPTGVGFCMYVRRDCLDVIGLLNEEKFGRGYGEENDLCQRALKAGWFNVITPNLYAFHEGGVSFSSTKQALIENAFKAIVELHPDYHLDIQTFIAEDPVKLVRINRLVQLLSTLDRPKVLQVSHEAGGGVKQHVEELSEALQANAYNLILTPRKGTCAVSLYMGTFPGADELIFRLPEELPMLVGLLEGCGVGFVHFHHSLGLNPVLFDLPAQLGTEYALTVHDFYWLGGNPTLTNEEGVFPGQYSDDLLNPAFPLPDGVSAVAWRAQLRGFIEGAKTIVFPSEYTLSLYQQYYALHRPVVALHLEVKRPISPAVAPISPKPRYNVGVLGALGKEKGADYLEQLAAKAKAASAPFVFKLLGFAYRELKGVFTTGQYDAPDLTRLMAEHDLDLILFPAQWPETYSYTLSYALASGLPIIAPDIGAFPERLASREHTLVYPFGIEPADLLREMSAFVKSSVGGDSVLAPPHAHSQLNADFYNVDYLKLVNSDVPRKDHLGILELPAASPSAAEYEAPLTTREIALLALWTLYRKPGMQSLSRAIPYGLRQRIKRKLTKRPLHEIVDLHKN